MISSINEFHLTDAIPVVSLNSVAKDTVLTMMYKRVFRGKPVVFKYNVLFKDVYKTKENPGKNDFLIEYVVLDDKEPLHDGQPIYHKMHGDKIFRSTISIDGTHRFLDKGNQVITYFCI